MKWKMGLEKLRIFPALLFYEANVKFEGAKLFCSLEAALIILFKSSVQFFERKFGVFRADDGFLSNY